MKKNLIDIYGNWGLVAGAAEGLGEAYSTSLARRGMNLIMVDHNERGLQDLAARLEAEYEITVRKVFLDLGDKTAADAMMKEVEQTSCRFFVYNAAFSKVKRFTENSTEDLDSYVDVNMRTPIRLLHAFAAFHEADTTHRKGVILMSSLAGIWGTKLLAPYGSTKAFNRILAEALHHEMKEKNFDIMTCVAGATATPAYLGTTPQYGRIRPHVMQPERVVEETLQRMGHGALFVPGYRNRFTFFLLHRILGRKVSVRLFNRTVGKMYRERLGK